MRELIDIDDVILASERPELRTFHDRIFVNNFKLHMLPKRYTYATSIFSNLIKGVTYFKNEEYTDDTIYHRMFSCGQRRYVRKCALTTDDVEPHAIKLTERKRRMRTCYIERLIYNDLFKHETIFLPATGTESPTQDKKHVDRRLSITKEEYQSCFPGEDIDVDIGYTDQKPIKLIIKFLKNGVNYVSEEYIKTINLLDFKAWDIKSWEYNAVVECWKRTPTKTYVKFQIWKNERPWSVLKTEPSSEKVKHVHIMSLPSNNKAASNPN